MVKIRQDNRVINKAVFLALAINLDGEKELLGLWFVENEGAKFWLNVLTELKNRGVEDILIVSAQLSSEALLGLIDWEVPGHKIGEIILWSTGW